MWTSRYVLENEQGERIDLTAPAPVFLVNVEGLGASSDNNYGELGRGFFQLLYSEIPQNGITGDLIYQTSAFENYQQIVNWIIRAKNLFFCYTPLNVEFKRRVKVNYISKDRRNRAGRMRSSISFEPLSPWFLPAPAEIGIATESADAKGYFLDDGVYGYTYNSDLAYGGEAAGAMEAMLLPAGHEPAAVVLRYTGAITDPTIRLVGLNSGTVYGICELDATLSAGDVLELCTMYDNSYIKKISGGVETDLIGSVNLAYNPYFRVPVDEPSVLSIESQAEIAGSAELLIYSYYRTV